MSTEPRVLAGTVLTHDEMAAWHAMHAVNLAAYRVGCAARGTRPAGNPYRTEGTPDQTYWWNEGFHGRPFAPVTDRAALHFYALDHPTTQIPEARVDASTASPAYVH